MLKAPDRRVALVLAAMLGPVSACIAPRPDAEPPPPPAVAPIVTTERGPRGGRLVLVDEDGARLADLTPAAHRNATIDKHPAWSTDGRWIAFASNRARRGLDQTSLWLVGSRQGSRLRRLTRERSVDRDPRWSPDGRHVVYASSTGQTFDLWILDLAAGADGPRPVGRPRPLVATDELDELEPSISPDGRTVVYMALDRKTQRSRLYRVPLAGGRARPLTDGPADMTPCFSPDGRAIAFAAPAKGRGDMDLWAVDADGGHRRLLVGEELGDETGPIWSADGRFLFATSVFRSAASGLPILSSLVFADLRERPVRLRALHDPAQVVTRLGAALAPTALDPVRLRRQPLYRAAVRRAYREMRERQSQGDSP